MLVLANAASSQLASKLIMGARLCILLSITSLMLCVPLLNKCTWIAILCLIVSGAMWKDWRNLLEDKVILTGLVLVLLITLTLAYGQASWHFSLRAWDKYLKVCYLLFFLPLFTSSKSRQQALYCLIFGVLISEIFSYLHHFNIFTFGYSISKHWLFVQDLDASYLVSYVAYLLANLAVDNKKYRMLFIVGFIVCSFDILFLNLERTGYIIYMALAALFLWQRFRWKGVLSALISIPLLFGSLYISSNQFHNRINLALSNVSDYHQGKHVTSIGLRLSFAEYSFKMIKQNWLFGIGVGSFEPKYRALNGPRMIDGTWPAHPHDEYIALLLQAGIVGLLVFLYWIYLQIRASFQLPKREKFLLQGLILGFCLLSFCNASLLVNPGGACYVIFLAVFLAAKYDRQEN